MPTVGFFTLKFVSFTTHSVTFLEFIANSILHMFLDCVKEPVAKVDPTQFRYTTQTSMSWPAFFIF